MKTRTAVLLLALLSSLIVFGQINNPVAVAGEVVSLGDKPVANARIIFTSLADGKTYGCTAGTDGKFHIDGVPAGIYKIEAEGPKGERIYSSQRKIAGDDRAYLKIVGLGSGIVPAKGSFDPLQEAKKEGLRGDRWLKVTHTTVPDLTLVELSHLSNLRVDEYRSLQAQANAAINHQDWRLAAQLLTRMIEIAPDKWALYQGLGMAQRNHEQYKDAIATFEKGLRLIQQDAGGKNEQARVKTAMASMFQGEGEAYFAMGDMQAAVMQFRRAAELDPDPALAYIRLCSAEYSGGHGEQAVAACNKAIEADPGEVRFYQVLAGVQNNFGKYNDAIRTYEKGVETARSELHAAEGVRSNINSISNAELSGTDRYNREIGQMLFGEGNAFFALKKYKEAAALFEQAADTYPAPALAYFNRCACLYDMKDLSHASEACEKAILLDQAMADAYFAKASAEYGLAVQHGKFALPHSASLALKKYLELAPQGFYSERARSILQEAGTKD